jgi:Rrf2 family protein
MKLTQKSDYALRAVYHLAMHYNNSICQAEDIAREQMIPREFIPKILNDLSKANIVSSFRGPHGGYKLAKAPDQITLSDVIECIEGKISITKCANSEHDCERGKDCKIGPHWRAIQNNFQKAMTSVKFSDIVES